MKGPGVYAPAIHVCHLLFNISRAKRPCYEIMAIKTRRSVRYYIFVVLPFVCILTVLHKQPPNKYKSVAKCTRLEDAKNVF